MLRNPSSSRAWRAAVPALLSLPLAVGACTGDRSVHPPTPDVTLWITPGAYHLGAPEGEPIAAGALASALKAALAASATPTVLHVRASGHESLGYDYLMARIAACEAGVRRLEYELSVTAAHARSGAPETVVGREEIGPPCRAGHPSPDTAKARIAAVRGVPSRV